MRTEIPLDAPLPPCRLCRGPVRVIRDGTWSVVCSRCARSVGRAPTESEALLDYRVDQLEHARSVPCSAP